MRSFAFSPNLVSARVYGNMACHENSFSANGVTPREQWVFRIFFIEPLQSFSTLIPNIFLAVKSINRKLWQPRIQSHWRKREHY